MNNPESKKPANEATGNKPSAPVNETAKKNDELTDEALKRASGGVLKPAPKAS